MGIGILYPYTAFDMAYASVANLSYLSFPVASPDHLTRRISDASLVQTLVRSTATINLSVPQACRGNSGWEKLHQTQSCSKIVQHAPCLLVEASFRLFNRHTSYCRRTIVLIMAGSSRQRLANYFSCMVMDLVLKMRRKARGFSKNSSSMFFEIGIHIILMEG